MSRIYHIIVCFNKIKLMHDEVINMNNKLVITKKLRGDDGYRVFSVRIKVDTFDHINELAEETGRTRNELIGMLLDFALEHSEVAGERAYAGK